MTIDKRTFKIGNKVLLYNETVRTIEKIEAPMDNSVHNWKK